MKHSLLTMALVALALYLPGSTIFVMQGRTGKGGSWADATGSLSDALLSAKPGDEVWVAKGTYYPSDDVDRKKSFILPAGVKMYGGFSGIETIEQQRNFQINKTILSGNIGLKDEYGDNSFTIVVIMNAGENTLLDGFILSEGNADGSGPTADKDRCGGALYMDGSGKGSHSNPIIQNCIFQNNHARDGGAAYLNGRSGECNPIFRNCQFLNNSSDLDGGAIFCDGRQEGQANPSFEDCYFIANEGNYGGAMCNYGGRGQSNPRLKNCVFRNNEAYLRGGAIFNMDVEGIAAPMINDCQFFENKAVTGKGIYTFSQPVNDQAAQRPHPSYKDN